MFKKAALNNKEKLTYTQYIVFILETRFHISTLVYSLPGGIV